MIKLSFLFYYQLCIFEIQIMLRGKQKTQSKDFKKKPNNIQGRVTDVADQNRLSQLKSKLERQRQLMKTTGKRFREQSDGPKKILSKQKVLMQNKPIANNNKLKESKVSLKELSSQSEQLSMSQTFQRDKNIQQINNKQVYQFLLGLKLQRYYQEFLDQGFDELDIIMEVNIDTLNLIKMKASDQRILFNQIKKRKQAEGSKEIGLSTEAPLSQSYSSINSRNQQKKFNSIWNEQPKEERSKPKPKPPKIQNFFVQKNFLVSLGGSQWKLEGQGQQIQVKQRKACSQCFKITYEPVRDGLKYFCSKKCAQKSIKSGVIGQQESWGMSLSTSMIRQYKS